MTIQEWQDSDFLPYDFDNIVKEKSAGGKDINLESHRVRQAAFNLACLKELKRQDRGWVLMIDTDEYLTYSATALRNFSMEIPLVEEPGSLAKLLDGIMVPDPKFPKLKTPCVPVFRQQFAARESTPDQIHAMVPSGFDATTFQTLRWRKFGFNESWYETKWGDECAVYRWVPNKVVIDLKRLRLQDLEHPENKGNPHRPLRSICTSNLYRTSSETPLTVHHYLGTIEQWLYRVGDKRGTYSYRCVRVL